jgi:mannose-6-phosphate isomerase
VAAWDVVPLAEPIPLGPNLVSRSYRGGGRLAAFRAEAGVPVVTDACEDWVGSVTRAWTPPGTPATDAGLTRLPDGSVLADVVGDTGVLVKLLDAGERLPVHCHPSRAFASSVLGSPYGKAEAWIVLETFPVAGAEPPNIRLGWRDGFSRAKLVDLIERREVEALLGAMPVREVRPGDVWFVPPGVPHAIGAGVFMVEVQEPTDFSIVAEVMQPVGADDAHLHRGWDVMVDAFDREPMTDERLDALRQRPTSVEPHDGLRETALLGADASRFFNASRLQLDGDAAWPYLGEFTVAVVVAGSGEVRGATSTIPLRRGITYAVAAEAGRAALTGKALEIIVCRRGSEPPANVD